MCTWNMDMHACTCGRYRIKLSIPNDVRTETGISHPSCIFQPTDIINDSPSFTLLYAYRAHIGVYGCVYPKWTPSVFSRKRCDFNAELYRICLQFPRACVLLCYHRPASIIFGQHYMQLCMFVVVYFILGVFSFVVFWLAVLPRWNCYFEAVESIVSRNRERSTCNVSSCTTCNWYTILASHFCFGFFGFAIHFWGKLSRIVIHRPSFPVPRFGCSFCSVIVVV